MEEAETITAHDAALDMLDTFASVGATRFDLTQTTRTGDKVSFRRSLALAELKRILPALLAAAIARQHNVIVRPYGAGVGFLQLDDLSAEQLPRLAPAVFLILETSPGNFQAWVALPGREDKAFGRRVRRGTGADATASGATRIAGSVNFKDKYAPGFPRVTIREARRGHRTTAAELEKLGLVAPPEDYVPLPPARTSNTDRWPSYAQALDGAPLDSEGLGPDRSRADFVWCMTAITWGFGVDETAKRLTQESSKARAAGKGYATATARNAALAVGRRGGRLRIGEHRRG